MHITQLRQADLNLLVVFTVLAEERNITRAATRLLLSQPAVSRALQRLRAMFHDDLLVRTPTGYEPTPQGRRILHELEAMLPQLDRLLSGAHFDPEQETAAFRIAATDNACQVLCPVLCREFIPPASKVSLNFIAWHDGTYEDLERGRLDLALNADDGSILPHLLSEVIYEEEFACVVASESKYSKQLTLKEYLAAKHIVIGILGGAQTIPEKRLAAIGVKRHVAMRVPYFSAAIRSVAGNNLIATVPKRLAEAEKRNPAIRSLRPPAVLSGFKYLMMWHPRVNTDAAHEWLRTTLREAGQLLSRA